MLQNVSYKRLFILSLANLVQWFALEVLISIFREFGKWIFVNCFWYVCSGEYTGVNPAGLGINSIGNIPLYDQVIGVVSQHINVVKNTKFLTVILIITISIYFQCRFTISLLWLKMLLANQNSWLPKKWCQCHSLPELCPSVGFVILVIFYLPLELL